MVIPEWCCSPPARDVQAQVLHSKENRFHRQAFLLRHRGGGEVCLRLRLLCIFPETFSELILTENRSILWNLTLVVDDYYSFYIINDVPTHMLLSSLYRCYLLSFFCNFKCAQMLIHKILEAVRITRAAQTGLTLDSSLVASVGCFQLCLCPACLSCCLPPTILLFCLQQTELSCFWTHPLFSLCSCRRRNDICRGTLFRPLRFFCKLRYVNWPTLPSQNTCMCCMCAANQSLHIASNSRLMLLLSYCFTK